LSPMQLYYITDRSAFVGDEATRRRRLLDKIDEVARAGVDYIQVREKDLPIEELEHLAREAVGRMRAIEGVTRILVNSRTDIALSVEADGVHLRSDDISPSEVFAMQSQAASRPFLIAVSCHAADDVRRAEAAGANFAVLAPIFGKPGTQPLGLAALRIACQGKLPVFALGGVTLENAQACLDAGAQGIAGIRLFQNSNVADAVRKLRSA